MINPAGALIDVNTLDGWNSGLFNSPCPPNGTWVVEYHNTTGSTVPVQVMVTCARHASLGLASPLAPPNTATKGRGG